jgi:ribosomal protein S18 acetylase RimI-like enzyme
MVTVRRAVPRDAPSLAVLAERTFRDAFADRNSPENVDLHCRKYFAPDIQAREISDPWLLTTVAEADGEMVGFTQLRLSQHATPGGHARQAELSRIYVTAAWQGRGVAQQLMQDAIDAAARAGSDRLWLGVWEHNPKAIAFYRKFGFEVTGEHAFMLGQDRQRDVIMTAKIG